MTLDLEQIQNSLITASIAVVVLLTVRIMIFLVVQNWVQKDRTPFANAVLKSFKLLRIPTIYWSFAIALLIGIASYEPSTKYIIYLTKSIHILLILSLSIVIAGIIKKMFRTLIENTYADLPEFFQQFTSVSEKYSDKLRIVSGKKVFELRPPKIWHKGNAVEWVMSTHGNNKLPIYIGDDTTDEDAARQWDFYFYRRLLRS